MNVIITIKKYFGCAKKYSFQDILKDKTAKGIKILHIRKYDTLYLKYDTFYLTCWSNKSEIITSYKTRQTKTSDKMFCCYYKI